MLIRRNYGGSVLAVFMMLSVQGLAVADDQFEGGNCRLFLTATNGAKNSLAVVNSQTKQITYVPTGGIGGATGNAGGVAVYGEIAAVVNFGSSTVTIFARRNNSMVVTQTLSISSPPVSVAFGNNHLVVLGQAAVESFPIYGNFVSTNSDGSVPVVSLDKSAAQVITYDGGVVYSEKSGAIVELSLGTHGVSGPGTAVTLPPAPNNSTPFGMVGRGANVYATIAHSDLEALIVNGQIVSTASGPTPYVNPTGGFFHAPCWNTLTGQFLFSSDSPGKQLLRYLVSDTHVFFDKPGVATFSGLPTDLATNGSLLGVIDGGDGVNSDVSLFALDSEGELTLTFTAKIAGAINGAALIQ